jgi:methyl-accepting chemotaxis protein
VVIQGITESASRVKVLVDQVNLGSQDQMNGIEQVLRAIQEMDKVTQNAASISEESAATSQELASQADSMNTISRELQMVVQG